MCYCGLDEVLREVAGNFTLLAERISNTAIHHRLKACVPWVKALLTGMMGEAVKPLLEGRLRILVADGSTVQGPGASGIQYRLHIAIDLVRLHLVHVVVTDEHTAESLTHYPLQDGDVVAGPHHLSISHHLTKGRQREIILQTSLQVTQPPRKPRHGAAVEFSEAPMVGIGLGVGFFSSGVGRCNVSSRPTCRVCQFFCVNAV
jgi:hypothetical protein